MSKDVKIEILYYKTSADVSLEFGLHGNYPLRLLSSSCNDKKSFLTQLKRAVSRSEIIITVGGYSEDNLSSFIARAIGKKGVVPDYLKSGIITEHKYMLPEGSIPLASKNKNFGGFLIECGPQTIISFTDNKKVMLDIVKKFLVDYITEHHNCYGAGVVFSSNVNTKNNSDTEELTDNTEDSNEINLTEFASTVSSDVSLDDETSEINDNVQDSAETTSEEETAEKIDQKHTSFAKIIFDDDTLVTDSDLNVTDVTDVTDITVDEPVEDSSTEVKEKVYLDDDDDDFIDFEDTQKQPNRHKKNRVLRFFCYILSLTVVLSTVLAIWYFGKNKPANSTLTDYYGYAQNIFSQYSENPATAFNKIKEKDNGVFTWLTVTSAGINHPVNTVKSLDNTYIYLNSLPNGLSDRRGTLFSLTDNEITHFDKNTVIYGSANPGGIFEKLNFETASSGITTTDGHYKLKWKTLSSFTHSKACGFDYEQTVFNATDDYINYLSEIDALSDNPTDQTFYGNEKLLILVAVTDNERYITVSTLSSITVLVTPDYSINSSTPSTDSSVNSSSEDITSSEDVSSSEDEEDDNDFLGHTPEIILPTLPSKPESTPSKPSSSVVSSGSSSNNTTTTVTSTSSLQSSSTVTSVPSISGTSSSANSSQQTSAKPSVPSNTVSSKPVQSSSSTSINSSSANSSTAVSSSVSKPNIDPLYTWDIMVAVKSTGPDRKGEVIVGTAAEVVAWIIEIEMSPTIHPPEALIAQAVVKYNWIINNGGRCSVNDKGEIVPPAKPPQNAMQTPTKQALQYANAAKGMVLTYGNTLALTYCHDTSAGFTAAYHNVWGGGNYPYLQGVECPVDKDVNKYEVSTTYTSAEIKAVFEYMKNSDSSTYKDFKKIDIDSIPKEQWLVPSQYDTNNAYCTEITVFGVKKKGTFLRNSMLTKEITGKTTIRSSAYTITYDAESDTFTVTTKGYGHGVGLSQQGAILYAKQGWSAEQILAHFFPGTTLIIN